MSVRAQIQQSVPRQSLQAFDRRSPRVCDGIRQPQPALPVSVPVRASAIASTLGFTASSNLTIPRLLLHSLLLGKGLLLTASLLFASLLSAHPAFFTPYRNPVQECYILLPRLRVRPLQTAPQPQLLPSLQAFEYHSNKIART